MTQQQQRRRRWTSGSLKFQIHLRPRRAVLIRFNCEKLSSAGARLCTIFTRFISFSPGRAFSSANSVTGYEFAENDKAETEGGGGGGGGSGN